MGLGKRGWEGEEAPVGLNPLCCQPLEIAHSGVPTNLPRRHLRHAWERGFILHSS